MNTIFIKVFNVIFKLLIKISTISVLSRYSLKKQQKTDAGESLIENKTNDDTQLEVKIAIVTEIFNDKQAASDRAKKAAMRKTQTQKILDIMNQKQNETLSNMTVEELQAQLDALNADDTESEDE